MQVMGSAELCSGQLLAKKGINLQFPMAAMCLLFLYLTRGVAIDLLI